MRYLPENTVSADSPDINLQELRAQKQQYYQLQQQFEQELQQQQLQQQNQLFEGFGETGRPVL